MMTYDNFERFEGRKRVRTKKRKLSGLDVVEAFRLRDGYQPGGLARLERDFVAMCKSPSVGNLHNKIEWTGRVFGEWYFARGVAREPSGRFKPVVGWVALLGPGGVMLVSDVKQYPSRKGPPTFGVWFGKVLQMMPEWRAQALEWAAARHWRFCVEGGKVVRCMDRGEFVRAVRMSPEVWCRYGECFSALRGSTYRGKSRLGAAGGGESCGEGVGEVAGGVVGVGGDGDGGGGVAGWGELPEPGCGGVAGEADGGGKDGSDGRGVGVADAAVHVACGDEFDTGAGAVGGADVVQVAVDCGDSSAECSGEHGAVDDDPWREGFAVTGGVGCDGVAGEGDGGEADR